MADEVPRKVSRRRRLWILIAATTTTLVLALALGLGLGLGLRHHHSITTSNDSQTSPSTSALPLLTPQTSNNFVVGSIAGQSPQDRRYNFTVALANGAPDGVNKTMLVVNGTPLRSCAVIFPLPASPCDDFWGRCDDFGEPPHILVSEVALWHHLWICAPYLPSALCPPSKIVVCCSGYSRKFRATHQFR